MTRARAAIDAFQPWAGLVVGLVALVAVHQIGSDSSFDHCAAAAPGPVLLVALIGLVMCLLSGIASWRSRRSGSGARRVIAVISVGSAALYCFAIILPMIAALSLPPCFG